MHCTQRGEVGLLPNLNRMSNDNVILLPLRKKRCLSLPNLPVSLGCASISPSLSLLCRCACSDNLRLFDWAWIAALLSATAFS